MTQASAGPAPDQPKAEQLDALFAAWNRSDAPGLAVGVMLNDAVIYRRGFGMASLETGQAITPHTRIRIGSITKHFTALLALLLAEEGKLDLDAPIRRTLPELSGPGGEPSIRYLLQHRGGSRCYLDLGSLAHGMTQPPVGRALAMQRRQTGQNFPPGTAMIYNNGGYHLVSLAVERAGGVSFAEQLRTRLLHPLGMSDTALIPSDYTITPGMATLHVPLPDGGWRRGLFPSEEISGEGGIVSTIADMLRWLDHLRRRDRFGAPSSWAELTALPVYPDGSEGGYALGLRIGTYRGARVIHHAGGVVGGLSQILCFPDHGLGIVVLANGALGADPVVLAERVADILIGHQLGDRMPAIQASDYPALLGAWSSFETGMVYGLCNRDGELTLTLCGASEGVPLTMRANGKAVASIGSDIIVDLQSASAEDGLSVAFGGERHTLQLADPRTVDPAVFETIVGGRYASADGDCTAEVRRGETGLRLVFQDPYGSSDTALTPLTDRMAISSADHGGSPFTAAISFDAVNGQAASFRASTSRTRKLHFSRIS